MKHIFFSSFNSLVVGALLCCSVPAFSQDGSSSGGSNAGGSGLQIGAMAGFNSSQFNSSGVVQGFMVGAYADYDYLFLNGRLGIVYDLVGGARPDMSTEFPTLQGGALPTGYTATYMDRQVRMHNISVPLMVSVYYPGTEGSTINPRLTVGISYSYTFGVFEERDIMKWYDNGAYTKTSDDRENVGGDYQSHQMAYMAGFGFDFNLDSGRKAFLEVLYKQGINEINKVELARPGNLGDVYTNTISISFGTTLYSF